MKTRSGPTGRDLETLVDETMASNQIVMPHGYRQKDAPDGSRVRFGRDVRIGFMSRYRIDQNGTWSIEEKMAVEW
jgi:hypothetical protein